MVTFHDWTQTLNWVCRARKHKHNLAARSGLFLRTANFDCSLLRKRICASAENKTLAHCIANLCWNASQVMWMDFIACTRAHGHQTVDINFCPSCYHILSLEYMISLLCFVLVAWTAYMKSAKYSANVKIQNHRVRMWSFSVSVS